MRVAMLAIGAFALGGIGLAQAAAVPTATQATSQIISDFGVTTIASTAQQQPRSHRHMQKKQKKQKMMHKHTGKAS